MVKNKKIGERIRHARVIANLSQENMASELGISVGAYSNIERSKTNITVSRLIEICKILKMEITGFFQENPETIQNNSKRPAKYSLLSDSEYVGLSEMKEELAALKKEVASLKKRKKGR